METPRYTIKFDRETCSRCGGTGRHSYCQRFRDVCFTCAGKGSHLTKAGAAARAAVLESCRPLTLSGLDVVAGDVADFGDGRGFVTVVQVLPTAQGVSWAMSAPVNSPDAVSYMAIVETIDAAGTLAQHEQYATLVDRRFTAADHVARIAAGLAATGCTVELGAD